jgi:hypothetical protein
MKRHPNIKDITGRRFGRLVVLRWLGPRREGAGSVSTWWECKCDCGTIKEARGGPLKDGRTTSCGCYIKELLPTVRRTHGARSSPEYGIWTNMKTRCLNPNNPNYKYWGARGIRICQTWVDSFETFYSDMGPRPSPCHSIERRDNEGPYSAANCLWVEQLIQANNKSNNVNVTAFGRTMTVAQWAREVGAVDEFAIHKRLRRGWAPEEAITTPSRAVRKWRHLPKAA